MLLRLTVIDPAGTGHPVEVVVEADAGAELATVRPALLSAAGIRDDERQLFCGAAALPSHAPIGHPPLLEGSVLTLGAPVRPAGGHAVLELRTVAGPDSGRIHGLPPGRHVIGRAAEATVRLLDPDVSRVHAAVVVGLDGVTVTDLGSANGTAVGDAALTTEPLTLAAGDRLHLGETTLVLGYPQHSAAAVLPDRNGGIGVNRPPRIRPPVPQVSVQLPSPPPPRDPPRFPLVALVLPLLAGPLMYFAFGRNPIFLLFILMSPLLMVGNYASDRRHGRAAMRRATADHAAEMAAARDRVASAVQAEVVRRRDAAPDPAEALSTTTAPRPRLWERRRLDEDFLCLRVGTGDLPAFVTVRSGHHVEQAAPPVARAVPVTLSLQDRGVIGLCGPRPRLEGLAAWVLGQLAVWHSPRDLELVVLAPPERSALWAWVGLLPHAVPSAPGACTARLGLTPDQVRARVLELVAQLGARRARSETPVPWTGPRTVVVLDGARTLRALPDVPRLLAQGPAVGLHFVCLETDAVALPAECTATVRLVGVSGTRVLLAAAGSEPVCDAVADLVEPAWRERCARALAPLRDTTPVEGPVGLPPAVRLLDVVPETDVLDPALLAAGWQSSPRSTRAVLGIAMGGVLSVDLRTDGPHALVAGTTGSGKSELLQTLVASLALVNRPDEMTFVLVDYKGGSAFKDCADLPHTVGLVTDLDNHLTERALTSLRAELRRRKVLLAAAGCKDIEDYVAEGHQARERLPRLVIVVDEFATLAEELPSFVGGLVGIAMLGRSLGVHLVLATQRPGGVVSADIKANTNLRIALRVTDPGESTDVLETREAAFISRHTPGRAYVRIGTAEVSAFQAGRVGGHAAPDTTGAVRARAVGPLTYGDPPARDRTPDVVGATDLARVVSSCQGAARRLGLAAAPSPWLLPLPEVVPLADLPASPASFAPAGVSDQPDSQRRTPWGLDLDHGGHLLVVGGSRSGRTTALRTLAGSLATRFDVADLHLYGIDAGGGGLLGLAALPHTGAVVARDQATRADRLLTRLLQEVDRRHELLSRGGWSGLAEQRAHSAPEDRLPHLVLLLDSWEGLAQMVEHIDHGRPVDSVLRLVREGGSAGLHVVLAGDRTALTGRAGQLIADRLLLRLADPGDYALAGIPARSVPTRLPPGRGLVAEGVVETQVALLGTEASGAAETAALSRIATDAATRAAQRPTARRPFRVDPLPATVWASTLEPAPSMAATSVATPAQTSALPAATSPAEPELPPAEPEQDRGQLWALVGVGGDELGPVGVDLAADGPAFVIAGPPGSGRSTALLTMGRSLLSAGTELVVVTGRRSPLRDLAGEPGVLGAFGLRDAAALGDCLDAVDKPFAVLVDDAEAVHDSGIDRAVMALLHPADERPRAVVVAGSSADLASQFRGLGADARRNRLGLLLWPGPGDGDLLGARVPRSSDHLPGRGILVARGRQVPLQVALPR